MFLYEINEIHTQRGADRSERALVYTCKRKLKEMKRARNNAVKQWKEQRKLIQSLPRLQY